MFCWKYLHFCTLVKCHTKEPSYNQLYIHIKISLWACFINGLTSNVEVMVRQNHGLSKKGININRNRRNRKLWQAVRAQSSTKSVLGSHTKFPLADGEVISAKSTFLFQASGLPLILSLGSISCPPEMAFQGHKQGSHSSSQQKGKKGLKNHNEGTSAHSRNHWKP